MAVKIFPFRWIASRLGTPNNNLITGNKTFSAVIHQIAEAIHRVSPHTPWKSNCLAQAIAARAMLRRRLIASTLYFGVSKSTDGQLEAHAWLRSGEIILTGDLNLERYAIVAIFTDYS